MKLFLKLQAVEYIDWFPGFIRCELTDNLGTIHSFINKIPIICGADNHFDESTIYPVEITIPVKELTSTAELIRISTLYPWDIKSEDGQHEFEVNVDQIIRMTA